MIEKVTVWTLNFAWSSWLPSMSLSLCSCTIEKLGLLKVSVGKKIRFSRTFFSLLSARARQTTKEQSKIIGSLLVLFFGSVCFFQSSSKLSSTRFLGQDIQHYQLFSESSIMFGRIEQVFCEVCWGKASFNVEWNEHRTSSSCAQLSTRLDTNKQVLNWALCYSYSCLFLYFSSSRWLSIYRH